MEIKMSKNIKIQKINNKKKMKQKTKKGPK